MVTGVFSNLSGLSSDVRPAGTVPVANPSPDWSFSFIQLAFTTTSVRRVFLMDMDDGISETVGISGG